jgi:hypothetical protein
MDGEIDIYLNKWRSQAGAVAPSPVTEHGQHLCPICHSTGERLLLLQIPAQSVWTCSYRHSFRAAIIPDDPESHL